MAATTSIKELEKMSVADLQREARSQRHLVGKLRIQVTLQKEKNTGKYQQEKKQLARMLTVLSRKRAESLQEKKANSTVSDSKTDSSPSSTK